MTLNTEFPDAVNGAAIIASAPDLSRYRQHVAHLDLPEARKTELLQAVWQIMRNCVDRAFGDDAAQLCRKAGDSAELAREAGGMPVIELEPIRDDTEQTLSCTFEAQARSDSKERR